MHTTARSLNVHIRPRCKTSQGSTFYSLLHIMHWLFCTELLCTELYCRHQKQGWEGRLRVGGGSVGARGLQRDVVYLGWPIAPSYMRQMRGEWGSCGVSANEYSCAQDPNKLWRSNSLFNLWQAPCVHAECVSKCTYNYSCETSKNIYFFMENLFFYNKHLIWKKSFIQILKR